MPVPSTQSLHGVELGRLQDVAVCVRIAVGRDQQFSDSKILRFVLVGLAFTTPAVDPHLSREPFAQVSSSPAGGQVDANATSRLAHAGSEFKEAYA
jgi:hypothetical protein